MARTDNLNNFLTDIANAIRNKTGTTATIPANRFDEKINEISTGVDTSDATAVASNILSGKTAYAKGSKITGTMTNQGSKTFTPSSSVQTSGAGYYSSVNVNAKSSIDIDGIIQQYQVESRRKCVGRGFCKVCK